MAIQFQCNACGRWLSVPDDSAGKTGRCHCGSLVQAPVPPAAELPAADLDFITEAPIASVARRQGPRGKARSPEQRQILWLQIAVVTLIATVAGYFGWKFYSEYQAREELRATLKAIFPNARDMTPEEIAANKAKPRKPMKSLAETVYADQPWKLDQTAWKCWVTEVEREPVFILGRQGEYHLKISIAVNTYQDDRPIRSLTGRLTIDSKDGTRLYDDRITIGDEGDNDSFTRKVYYSFVLDYDDSKPEHRTLRHGKGHVARFRPTEVMFADGKRAGFRGGE